MISSAGTKSLEERVKAAMISVLQGNPTVRDAFKDIVAPPPEVVDVAPAGPPLEVPPPLGGRVSVPPTPAPVPSVSIVELPAEPGCRKFSTKTCRKVPIVVPKKVPYEECEAIPSIECFFVLKTVDDLECSPVRYCSQI